MASSGSYTTNSISSSRTLTFSWSVQSQSIENNTTTIAWTLKGSGGTTGSWVKGQNFRQWVNGNYYESLANRSVFNGTVIMSGTTTITHNADGTKSFSANTIAQMYSYTDNTTGSGSWELPTIPRTSNVTATDGNIESAITINIGRASSSFTHTLRYTFGSLSGTIATGVATSYGWTIPSSFYGQIPNAKSGKCTIYCDTYNGSTLIGTKSTVFTVNIDVVANAPNVSAVIIDTNELSINLTGDNKKLIKFISNPKITITSNAKNGATIVSNKVVCGDGKSANGNTTFIAVESGKYVVTTTDSRGISNSVEYNLSIIDYIKLTLNPTLYRPQPTTGEVELLFSGNYFNNSFGKISNELHLSYRYKEVSTSNWSEYIELTSEINNNYYSNGENPISLDSNFDYTKAFNFELLVSDKINSQLVVQITVNQGLPIFDVGKDDFKHNTSVFLKSGNEILDYDVVDTW